MGMAGNSNTPVDMEAELEVAPQAQILRIRVHLGLRNGKLM